MIRTYEELVKLDTFEDRYNYLKIGAAVGIATFGTERWINQRFYTSKEWRDLRHYIIVRDNGCDLGVDGYYISNYPIIHHMNPLTVKDLTENPEIALDPEFLISVTHSTHNAIHYGDASQLRQPFNSRRSGDTKLW